MKDTGESFDEQEHVVNETQETFDETYLLPILNTNQ